MLKWFIAVAIAITVSGAIVARAEVLPRGSYRNLSRPSLFTASRNRATITDSECIVLWRKPIDALG